MPGLFITGTDTGAGKTEITAAVARSWRRQGRAFAVCKPAATGARLVVGRLVAEDTERLATAAGGPDLEAVTPWAFAEPASPPVAARAAGVRLDLDEMVAHVRRLEAGGTRTVLVEGVGGLLCPLTESATVADLAGRLGYPLVVVARRSLGTLNHTLLTLEVAVGRNLPVVGVVVSETAAPASLAERTNVEELARRISVPILAAVPYRKGGYEEEIPQINQVDWWSLAR